MALIDWCNFPAEKRGGAIALGNFDGVHLGHKHLIGSLHAARPQNRLSVLTFTPHPREIFRPQDPPFRLTRPEIRAEYLKEMGVEEIIELPFDAGFSHMEAEDFIQKILIEALGAVHIACGADFAFGHRRGGDVALLEKRLGAHGVGVTIVPQLSDNAGPISSSRIRRLLQEGYPERAAELLERSWEIVGEVVYGDQRGRLLGFPTANIRLECHIEPARGVYAVQIGLPDGRFIPGVANIGKRPTINDGQESRLEAHLFDFDGDLYGKTLRVRLIALLREEKRFSGLDALKAQIGKDAQKARALLEKRERKENKIKLVE